MTTITPSSPILAPAAPETFSAWAAKTDKTMGALLNLFADLGDPPTPASEEEAVAVIAFLRQHRLDAGSDVRTDLIEAATQWSDPVKKAAGELLGRCCWNLQGACGVLERLAEAEQFQMFSPALFGWTETGRHHTCTELAFVNGTVLGRYTYLPADHFLRALIRADECVQHDGHPHLDLGAVSNTSKGPEPAARWWYGPSVAASTRAEVARRAEQQANLREREEQQRREEEVKRRYAESVEGRIAALEAAKRELEAAKYNSPAAWR